MKFAYGVVGAGLVLWLVGSAQAADRSAWQIKADIAVRKVFDESVAEKVRALFSPIGKNAKVKNVEVEPDGDGVRAVIKVQWSGSLIALDYGVTVIWRFTKDAHLSSDAEGFIGIGIPTDKTKRDLDDYLRTKVYPLVQADAAKPLTPAE